MEKFILNKTSYFGEGARKALPDEIKKRGFKKVLVVTDKSLFEAGICKKVTDILEANEIKYDVYSNVKPNPTIKNVLEGVEECKKIKADLIVAVGGGSSIDTGKGISILMTNPTRKVESLNGLSNTKNNGMPMIAIPTTAGTAAEVTINYVITDEKKKIKMVCVDEHSIPIVAIIDTELMATMPKFIAATTGMDALTHAIEGYICKNRNTMSQMYSIKAIQLLYDNLEKAVNDKDQTAINNVGLGQYIAGMAFSNVGLGIVHSMAHQLGAVYDTPHGLANAILLPTVMEFNGEVSYEEFRKILTEAFHINATYFTKEEIIKTFCECIRNLAYDLGITQTVKDTGAKQQDFEMLAEKAMNDPCKPGNPREVSKDDFIDLYRKAW